MLKKIFNKNNTIWLITGFLIVGAITVRFTYDHEQAAQIGDWLAGFASALAFLWLIAGFYLQSTELKLQRHELSLQREALKLQTEEFKDLNKYQSLEHIRKIISEAEEKLGFSPNELFSKILISEPSYKDIFNSDDSRKVLSATTSFFKHYAPIFNFMENYSAALQMYLDSNKIPYIRNETDKPSTFLVLYMEHAKNVPYLSRNHAFISKAAELLFRAERMFTGAALAGMVATEEGTKNGMWKEGAIQKMYDDFLVELEGDETSMPIIVKKHYPKKA